MIDWSIYEKRLSINGTSQRERIVNNAKNDILKKSINLPSYNIVSTTLNGIDKNIGLTILSTNSNNIKKISNLNNDVLSVGMILNWDNSFWMITSLNFSDEIYQSGTIQQCNFKLKYQNNSPTLLEEWCVITNTYSETSSSGKIVSVPIGKTVIWLPYNDNTRKIYKDKRILLEKSFDKDLNEIGVVYKVSGFDSKFFDYGNGKIITLTIESDSYNKEKDNLVEMVADYIVNDNPTTPVDNTLLNCNILGNNTIRMGGSKRTLTCEFFNKDGSINILAQPVWEVDFPAQFEPYIHFESNGNFINIWTDANPVLIGEFIKVTLKDEDEKYKEFSKTLEVT